VGADPVLVAASLGDRLAASLDDGIASAYVDRVPHRVRQLAEDAW
jgi:hypothetical protein